MTSNLGKRIARIEADAAKPFDLDTLTADDLLAGRLPKGALLQLVHLSHEEDPDDQRATVH
jgi:hypothetical protein